MIYLHLSGSSVWLLCLNSSVKQRPLDNKLHGAGWSSPVAREAHNPTRFVILIANKTLLLQFLQPTGLLFIKPSAVKFTAPAHERQTNGKTKLTSRQTSLSLTYQSWIRPNHQARWPSLTENLPRRIRLRKDVERLSKVACRSGRRISL